MKKIFRTIIGLALLLPLMFSMESCSSDASSEAESLLATVPADVDGVAIVNVEQLLTKAGCKVKDSKVEWSPEIKEELSKMKDPELRNYIELLAGDGSGVSAKASCIFYGSRIFITGNLNDPESFKKKVEEIHKTPFAQEGGANVNGNIAYIGNQFWIGVPGLPESSELVKFTKLNKRQSIAGNPASEKLTSLKDDVSGLGYISSLLGTAGRNRAQISMAMAAMFEKATMINFSGNAKDNQLIFEGTPVTDEGKPAKFLLPAGKIDTGIVAKLGGNAETVMAVEIPSDLTKKVIGMFSSFGGGLPEAIANALKEIEGTSAVASGKDGMIGVISTSGTPSPGLVELVGKMSGDVVTIEGNSMVLNKGEIPGGPIDIAPIARNFKGAMLGIVTQGMFGPEKAVNSLMLVPSDNTLKIRLVTDLGPDGWKTLLD